MTESLPMVLVPGLNCTARLFAEQIPFLWRYGPVMIADHRRGDSMAVIARQILADAPPRFALLGLSMGGYIAFAMLREARERIARLALLDTVPRADLPEQTERRKVQLDMALSGRFAEIPDLQWPGLVHEKRRSDLALKRVVVDMAQQTGADAFARQLRAIMDRPDSRPDLASIKCPTLVLVGEGDTLTPPDIARDMAASIAGSRFVVVPDSGHLSTLERPESVNAALAEWMA